MNPSKHCHEIGAAELVAQLRAGSLSLHEYLGALGQYTEAVEPQVQAFASHSREVVALQVERLDSLRHTGMPLPGLYGVPVGVKDNIDTMDYPTELGFAGTRGRTPGEDALLVHKLREAGAIVWGKTRCTELAYMEPTVTRNPRALDHTPGGSSSGSAAAVAAGMVPVAIGTQTNGSVIRPAAFCGVFGFKPSRDLIFNGGVLACSPSLDQVGVFARNVEDLAEVAQVLVGGHEGPGGRMVFPMRLGEVCREAPPMPPRLMFVRTPQWDRMDPQACEAFEELREELKDCMVEVELPASIQNALGWHKTIMEAEMSVHLRTLLAAHGGRASAATQAVIERGAAILASDYLTARERMDKAARGFDEFFDHFDAIVTPATLGAAPAGLTSTGDPVMCTLWTFAGLPALSLPLLHDEGGLPIGVQLVGAARNDARLLRTARWLTERLA
ncbi:MAG: amidase [Hydrogenophaga sp.]|uniref:amidase n=1 Tax=Hydrogenophaga sp. TaxID=1904254 RepID=UPI0026200819|nr:amidase [Hydrogenophaga sp.]MCV0438416.1 amidase [Hydrogenophaga sp.]